MDLTPDSSELDLDVLLESLLFVASGPVSVRRLAKVLDASQTSVHKALQVLADDYVDRGLRLQWHDGQVQLTTAPKASAVIERFLALDLTGRLSQAALEVLSVIAYLQPVTRPRIDEIRGVNSDAALRTLLNKELIEEQGRRETPGRPILYGTTVEFLQAFGIASTGELPPLPESPPVADPL